MSNEHEDTEVATTAAGDVIDTVTVTDLSSAMKMPVEDDDDEFSLDHLDLGAIEPDSYQEDDGSNDCVDGACKI